MSIRLDPEDALQMAAVNDFRWKNKDKLIFAIPNGGGRSKLQGAILKMTGVLRGVFDLFIPCPSKGFHGLWLETKVQYADGRKNTLSKEQKEFREYVLANGYQAAVYYSIEEFQKIVNEYLK